MNIIKKPIKSFKGDGKFVYVCYSLEDSEVVFPILIKLDENRCRVRYDECNQDEVKIEGLRKHNIKNCEVFLAFLSQKALQSLYVVNQLETAQTLGANVFVVSLDGLETADSASHMFGEGSKGIRLDETDENSFMEVMDQLLKDCQEPEKIEERVFSYEELLDEVYPDQENANKEAFINNTDTDNEKIKKAAASATKASSIAKKQKRQKNGRSFFNALLVVGAMALIAFLIYLFFGEQISEMLSEDNQVVNFIPALRGVLHTIGMITG